MAKSLLKIKPGLLVEKATKVKYTVAHVSVMGLPLFFSFFCDNIR